jgi:small subunit ribosomal protein S17
MTQIESKQTVQRRRLSGVVTSASMAKTAVVRVDRRVAHQKYGKYYTLSTKLKAHDEEKKAKVGDLVEIEETRPISRDKRWRIVSVTAKNA